MTDSESSADTVLASSDAPEPIIPMSRQRTPSPVAEERSPDSAAGISSPPLVNRRAGRARPSQMASRILGLEQLEVGSISWNRRTQEPLIWFPGNGGPRWIRISNLSPQQFDIVRDSLAEGIQNLQSRARSNYIPIRPPSTVFLPPPHERAFLRQIFNNHLTEAEKRRYIVEFKHTVVGSSTCYACLNIDYTEHKKCLHPDCHGMCSKCFESMGDCCPSCGKEQIIQCPICREDKKKDALAKSKGGCNHYICYACLGKAYSLNKPITQCPLCRGSWLQQ